MFRNTALLLTSCLVCLFIGEAASRTVFDPIDFLKVDLQPDPILSYKIAGHESGHDALGFRNKSIPEKTEILAIGDSMTYGNMAPSTGSWPAHYERLSGESVYNAGIGGYGPVHYLHNLRMLAPELQPDTVIMMVYVGNDFLDAYNLVYSMDHWADYRRDDNADQVEPDSHITTVDGRFMGESRQWLAKNSVLYRVVTQSPLFDKARIEERKKAAPNSYIVSHNGQDILLSQRPHEFTRYDDPRIQEGFDISMRALHEAKAFCEENGIDFKVAIMPVREGVYLDATPELFTDAERAELTAFKSDLDALHTDITEFLMAEDIPFVDLQDALTAALKTQNIYPSSDGHPNMLGYEVAAQAMITAFGAPES